MLSSKDYEKLQETIEYKFNNLEVLRTALTHKSYLVTSYNDKKSYNERMEFLGDSILSAVISETLYLTYPSESEGKLSQLKAQIVSASNLSIWAREINLGDYIFLGKSEDILKARNRESLLCNVFEAVVGAVYLDGGFENAKKIILKFLDAQKEIIITDYKSWLQELTQSVYKELPEYKIIKELGPDHNKKFEAAVYVKRMLLGKGIGSSKKKAQQSAAEQAMKSIK
jgi:ribonuclease-3